MLIKKHHMGLWEVIKNLRTITGFLRRAKADIADDFVQSFSKSGVNALVACVMAIICITALNLACEHIA
jgi:hypothetical protein